MSIRKWSVSEEYSALQGNGPFSLLLPEPPFSSGFLKQSEQMRATHTELSWFYLWMPLLLILTSSFLLHFTEPPTCGSQVQVWWTVSQIPNYTKGQTYKVWVLCSKPSWKEWTQWPPNPIQHILLYTAGLHTLKRNLVVGVAHYGSLRRNIFELQHFLRLADTDRSSQWR